jgi:hypothetical protein
MTASQFQNSSARPSNSNGNKYSAEVSRYFERFGFCGRQIHTPPARDLGIVVVIPCFDEPNLISSLESIHACEAPECSIEVIVIINSSENAAADVVWRNEETRRAAEEWVKTRASDRLQYHILSFPNLPAKKAGVGLARKIGMDEALRRFDSIGNPEGVIACFDADCVCEANYLTSIKRFFREHPRSPGCSIYFEHPLDGPEAQSIYEAITLYELHLRYYVEALRWARFPHAYHTIGSSMAVRARIYQEQGGMNKRQAGEDFYFLHKVIPLGAFGELNRTRIVASPRASHRVPFGTGKAVREILDSGTSGGLETYPLAAFGEMKDLFALVPRLFKEDQPANLSELMSEFLALNGWEERLAELRANTRSAEAFEKRFFRWFDGFLAMKYIHYARDNRHGPGNLVESAAHLFEWQTGAAHARANPRELLLAYRDLQRSSARAVSNSSLW